jgi:hypothetical protein
VIIETLSINRLNNRKVANVEHSTAKWHILFVLSGLQLALAVPSIENVTGSIADGDSITISGNGFGDNGPNLELFDDFEKGANGTDIETGPGSATVGEWTSSSGAILPQYSNLEALSGQMSFRADFTAVGVAQSWTSQVEKVFSEPTTEFFGCWWWLIPAGTNVPGEGASNGVNWKTVWIMDGFQGNDDDLFMPVIMGPTYSMFSGNTSAYRTGVDLNWSKGQWKRIWVWLKGSTTASGQVNMWELTGSKVEEAANDNNVQVYSTSRSDQPHEWGQIHINAYGRPTSNCYPSFDDVYLATGPNARARIEIGNAPNYMACTNLTICTPDSWSDTSIIATVRQGRFQAQEGAFLYVFDANGVCNMNGFAIEFGTSTPPSIRVVSPTKLKNGAKLGNVRLCNVLGQFVQKNRTGIRTKGVWFTFGNHQGLTRRQLMITR